MLQAIIRFFKGLFQRQVEVAQPLRAPKPLGIFVIFPSGGVKGEDGVSIMAELFERQLHRVEGLTQTLVVDTNDDDIANVSRSKITTIWTTFSADQAELVKEVVARWGDYSNNIQLLFYELSPEGDKIINAWMVVNPQTVGFEKNPLDNTVSFMVSDGAVVTGYSTVQFANLMAKTKKYFTELQNDQ